jgi:hypothetical protein
MDGTFRVVRDPFTSGQLESIHGFVKNNEGLEKQGPMAFILMSRRRTEDYVKVLTSLKQSLEQVSVESFVMDFEQGKQNNISKYVSNAIDKPLEKFINISI